MNIFKRKLTLSGLDEYAVTITYYLFKDDLEKSIDLIKDLNSLQTVWVFNELSSMLTKERHQQLADYALKKL